ELAETTKAHADAGKGGTSVVEDDVDQGAQRREAGELGDDLLYLAYAFVDRLRGILDGATEDDVLWVPLGSHLSQRVQVEVLEEPVAPAFGRPGKERGFRRSSGFPTQPVALRLQPGNRLEYDRLQFLVLRGVDQSFAVRAVEEAGVVIGRDVDESRHLPVGETQRRVVDASLVETKPVEPGFPERLHTEPVPVQGHTAVVPDEFPYVVGVPRAGVECQERLDGRRLKVPDS